MKKVLVTIVLMLFILISGFLIYIFSGMYDISQLTPHNKLTKTIIGITTHHSINKRLNEIVVPENLKDSAMIVKGFQHYNEMCVMCHSAPGGKSDEMAQGLYPKPPRLYFYAKEDDAKEFFWIIKYGIKMTSMPAFKPTHDDQKIWAMTAFITRKLPKMSPDEYKSWVEKYAEADKDEETGNDSK